MCGEKDVSSQKSGAEDVPPKNRDAEDVPTITLQFPFGDMVIVDIREVFRREEESGKRRPKPIPEI